MATISKVRVKNFGSICDSGWIPIEDTCTAVLGPNGAGKSNFLNAVTEFGRRDLIPNQQLCKYTSAPNRQKSSIPIVSIKFTDLGISDAPYVQEPFLPSDLNSTVTHHEIGDAEGSADVDSELDISTNLSESEVTITRYADGTHKIHLNDGRRIQIGDLISKRAEELEAIGRAIVTQQQVKSAYPDLGIERAEISLSELQEIDTYLTVVEGDSTLDSDRTDSDNVTLGDTAEDIQRITSVLSELRNPAFEPLSELPSLFQNTDIELVDGVVSLEEIDDSAAYQGFLDAAGMASSDLTRLRREEIDDRIADAESRLTDLLNGYLSLNSNEHGDRSQVAVEDGGGEFEVNASLSREQLELEIREETGASFAAQQQSTGIRWLLGFLLTVIHGVGDNDEPGLVILDDPGVHLHPEAQELLLASLETLTPRKQVIYSTHSPFLIDNSKIDNTRLAEHQGTDGTAIHEHTHRQSSDEAMDSMAPIRESLGATLATLPFGNSQNILVEGYTDRQYLNTFNQYFDMVEGRPSLEDDIAFVDGSGGSISYMAQFLEAEGLEYVILLDDQEDGLAEGIVDAGIDESKIHRLSDALSRTPAYDLEIEDLLPEELFCEVVTEIQEQDIESEVLKGTVEGRQDRIVRETHAKLAEMTHDNYIFPKGEIADRICLNIRDQKRKTEKLNEDVLSDMAELIHYLSNLFE